MLYVLAPIQLAFQTSQDNAPPLQQTSIEKNARRLAYQSTTGDLSDDRIETMHQLVQRGQTLWMTFESQNKKKPIGEK